jgi:cell division protein FtsB
MPYFCRAGSKYSSRTKLRKRMRRVFYFLRNKYTITVLFLGVWVTFFDKNDMFSQNELRHKLQDLQNEKDYYITQIAQNKNDLNELKTNPANLEKFAREKYLMKKDNEDIFVLVAPSKKQNTGN